MFKQNLMSQQEDDCISDLEIGYKEGKKAGKRIGIIIGATATIPILVLAYFISQGIMYW